MRTRKSDTVILAGMVAFALAGWLTLGSIACQKKAAEETAAAAAPATEQIATTTTTTTTVEETAPVTADPVIVSQRNAKVRKGSRPRRSDTTVVGGERPEGEGRPGYSDERRGPESAVRAEVPAGTILRVSFNETISTATAKVGDTVSGEVLDDILAEDGTVAARSGSRVTGKIEHVVDSGKLARPAELRLRLMELETRSGTVPISTSAYDRVGKTHTKRNVGYIAGGAAVGAIVGQVLGKDTESTLKGAAAGAAVGTGVAAATGDLDFQIDAGRTVAFTLEEPIRVRR